MMIAFDVHELVGCTMNGAAMVRLWVGTEQIERQFTRKQIDDHCSGDGPPQERLRSHFYAILERDGVEGVRSSMLWRLGEQMPT